MCKCLQLGTGGKRLFRIVAESRFANYANSKNFNCFRQITREAFAALQPRRIFASSGWITFQFGNCLPLAIWLRFDLQARFASAYVKPTAVVKRFTVGKQDSIH